MLFTNTDTIKQVKEKPFKLEKDIQSLCEKNLGTLLGLQFVKSEFALHNFRLDTLAFDHENSSFVIIEYKRDKNFSVIDQGYAYLSLMLNNKADFILEYNESMSSHIKRDEIDWSQSKVIFIAPSFTTYQKEAINFKDLPIELWEINQYENNYISFDQIQKYKSSESIKTITKADSSEEILKEIKVYTEDDHLENADIQVVELYKTLKQGILNLAGDFGEFEIRPKKLYIAFVLGKNVVDIHIQKRQIKMWINLKKGELNDPLGLTKDVSVIGHWGNGDYEVQLANDENIEYLLGLIKKSASKNNK